jgi:hypothetical protein
MSITSFLSNAAVAGVVGGVAGALLTGWFGIRVKRLKRVQQRRAEVYVDMLAWIAPRTQKLRQISVEGPDKRAESPGTKKRTTFPDPRASELQSNYADPGTGYLATLRARVVAFGSHDITRAFDRWTNAYLMSRGTVVECTTHPTADYEVDFNAFYVKYEKPDCKYSAQHAIRPKFDEKPDRSLFKTIGFWLVNIRLWRKKIVFLLKRRIDSGLPDGKPGGLTTAIELCASKELRRG